MAKRLVLGLSAGPSADGIRAALVEATGRGGELRVRVLASHTEGFDADLRQLLLQVSTPETGDLRQLALVHRVLGEAFALTARRLADRASVSLPQVLCVGCHGFDAWHKTEKPYTSALTLGAAAVVAERLGITVMHDFRWRDLACQGIGAPLMAVPAHLLFHAETETRLVLHLGGLTQGMLLPASGDLKEVQAWEIGPGNALINALVEQLTQGKERYDAGGHHAVQGRQIPDLLQKWQRHPFLLKSTPRATPRSGFAEQMAKQAITLAEQHQWEARDLLCTAHHLVAWTVKESLKARGKNAHPLVKGGSGMGNAASETALRPPLPPLVKGGSGLEGTVAEGSLRPPLPPLVKGGSGLEGQSMQGGSHAVLPLGKGELEGVSGTKGGNFLGIDQVILTGGGAKNGFLWRLLEEQLEGVTMVRSETFGIPGEAAVAVQTAVLACFLLDSTPGNLPQATGATGARVLGSITPGSASNWGACLDWFTGRETNYPPWEED